MKRSVASPRSSAMKSSASRVDVLVRQSGGAQGRAGVVGQYTCALDLGRLRLWPIGIGRVTPLGLRQPPRRVLIVLAGNAALSRRARQASRLSAVVVRFSRSRKRYERQGTLVEEAALESAEAQGLAEEDVRRQRHERDRQRRADQDLAFQARLAEAVVRLFPGCPAERAEASARHAGTRGGGRVGRSAAGRALDEQAVRLAVVASVQHQDTD